MASSGKALSEIFSGFNLDLYKHLAEGSSNDNIFMSPSSVMIVLSMLHVGARNNTEKQMSMVLKLQDVDRKSFLSFMEKFVTTLEKGSDSVTIKTANRLYPHSDKSILEEYLATVSKHFHADLKSMDYTTKSDEARQEINKWVEEMTNQKITNLLPSGSLNALTAMVVVNAIYFKGNWATQFKPSATKKMKFSLLNSTTKTVDMMNGRMKKVKYGGSSDLACKVLEMPYVGEDLAMIVVLPEDPHGLRTLEGKINLKSLQSLVQNIHPMTVDVSLPKFKLESTLELKSVLSALGMPDLFDAVKSDLSGMGEELYVSKVFHKAYVDVNEEGTEAAAATAAVVMKRSLQITQSFIADHPFMFMIWDHRLEVPLFIGRLTDPSPSDGAVQQTRDEL